MKKVTSLFFGIIIGLIFIIGGIILIFWNEKNNVKNIAIVDELRKIAVDISSESIDSSNDGKLVAVNGKLNLTSSLGDSIFGVSIKTAKLNRNVEMYQYVESCSTDSNNNKSCEYKKEWKSSVIDSSKFKESGYSNPTSMPYQSMSKTADSVTLGKFNVSSEQLSKLPTDANYSNFASIPSGYKQSGVYLMNSSDVNNPQIGDVRISFKYNNSETISILAMQKENSLVDYTTKNNNNINYISTGTKNATSLINEIENGNKILKWILRGVGLFLEILGVALLFSPLTTVSSYVPILGSLVGTATFIVSLFLGSIITLTCTAFAWILYRPVLGISLVVIAGILFYILKNISKKSS